MKKALAAAVLAVLFVTALLYSLLDHQSNPAIHKDFHGSIAFNSLYIYRSIKRVNIILTTIGHHMPGLYYIDNIYVQYGDGKKHKMKWQPTYITYDKSLNLEGMWYSQEHRITLHGDGVLDWTATEPVRLYIEVRHRGHEFMIVSAVQRW